LRFIGVDMASQPANTWLVVLESSASSNALTIVDVQNRASDTDILAAILSTGTTLEFA